MIFHENNFDFSEQFRLGTIFVSEEIAILNLKRAKQEDKLNEAITKFNEDQKKAVAETERAALIQRQELLRERESKIWDTEESHLQEKHQTARSQLKDQFLLQVKSERSYTEVTLGLENGL